MLADNDLFWTPPIGKQGFCLSSHLIHPQSTVRVAFIKARRHRSVGNHRRTAVIPIDQRSRLARCGQVAAGLLCHAAQTLDSRPKFRADLSLAINRVSPRIAAPAWRISRIARPERRKAASTVSVICSGVRGRLYHDTDFARRGDATFNAYLRSLRLI